MELGDIVFSIVGWIVILGAAIWYVNRTKHSDLKLGRAFGIFVGIFGGITIAALFVLLFIWYSLGFENKSVPSSVSVIFALAVVFPAWRVAVNAIRRKGKESDD